ncbi:MAG: uridine kinase [Mycoplasmoidaceae bacterium]|nr:MAG: uridine kinase [Mycoplasmoidaceae bacterium]
MKKGIKPILVLVSGGSGSGKTTVAELIKKNIPKGCTAEVISFDNFYLSKEKIKTDNYDSPEAIDWFSAREAVSFLVENNTAYNMPIYDYHTRTVNSTVKVKPANVIIFEGILSLYNDDIRNMADIKIFVDVPDDERLIRRVLRDQEHRGADLVQTVKMWRETVIKMHQKYVEPTKFISDIIIPWSNPNMVPIKAISGALEYMIYSKRSALLAEITEKEAKVLVKKNEQEKSAAINSATKSPTKNITSDNNKNK